MAHTIEVDVTVLGGLPITVEGVIYGAEPDVGIGSDYVGDWGIVAIAGKAKNANWLLKRLTKSDEASIVEAIMEASHDY